MAAYFESSGFGRVQRGTAMTMFVEILAGMGAAAVLGFAAMLYLLSEPGEEVQIDYFLEDPEEAA